MSNTGWQQKQPVRTGRAPWMEKHLADGQLSDAFKSNKGGLHRAAGVPEGKTIPVFRVKKLAASGTPHEKHMAQASINMNPRHYGKK